MKRATKAMVAAAGGVVTPLAMVSPPSAHPVGITAGHNSAIVDEHHLRVGVTDGECDDNDAFARFRYLNSRGEIVTAEIQDPDGCFGAAGIGTSPGRVLALTVCERNPDGGVKCAPFVAVD